MSPFTLLSARFTDATGGIDDVPVHGNTDPGILRATLQRYGKFPADFEARLPKAYAIMCAEVAQNAGGMSVELCPGIRDLLAELRRRGKLLGVVTGNLEPIGWRKLQLGGIREFFDFGSFSDKNETRADIFRHGIELARAVRGPEATVLFRGRYPQRRARCCPGGNARDRSGHGNLLVRGSGEESPTFCAATCEELLLATSN